MMDVREAPTIADATEDTVHHLTWCHNENRSLCGADVTNVPFTSDPVSCVVCTELDNADPEYEDEGCTCPCCKAPV